MTTDDLKSIANILWQCKAPLSELADRNQDMGLDMLASECQDAIDKINAELAKSKA